MWAIFRSTEILREQLECATEMYASWFIETHFVASYELIVNAMVSRFSYKYQNKNTRAITARIKTNAKHHRIKSKRIDWICANFEMAAAMNSN